MRNRLWKELKHSSKITPEYYAYDGFLLLLFLGGKCQPCGYMTYDLKSKILLLDIGKTKVSSHGEDWGAVETQSTSNIY